MKIVETKIPDLKLIEPARFGDHRGYFGETYSKRKYDDLGIVDASTIPKSSYLRLL